MTNKYSIKNLVVILLSGVGLYICWGVGPGQASGLQAQGITATRTADAPETPDTGKAVQFQVVQMQAHPPAALRIKGAISEGDEGGEVYVDMATLHTLEPHSISTSTVVTDGVLTFDGILMRTVLDYVGAHGTTVTATALNGYEVEIPIKDFDDFDVVLAWSMDGERLEVDDKGPFWIVYPRDHYEVLQDIRYDYRWVWQLNSLQVN